MSNWSITIATKHFSYYKCNDWQLNQSVHSLSSADSWPLTWPTSRFINNTSNRTQKFKPWRCVSAGSQSPSSANAQPVGWAIMRDKWESVMKAKVSANLRSLYQQKEADQKGAEGKAARNKHAAWKRNVICSSVCFTPHAFIRLVVFALTLSVPVWWDFTTRTSEEGETN